MSAEHAIREAEIEIDRLRTENDLLRALLAWGNDPCIYCGLEARDMSQCKLGFPGCSRSDDMQGRWDKRGWTNQRPNTAQSPPPPNRA